MKPPSGDANRPNPSTSSGRGGAPQGAPGSQKGPEAAKPTGGPAAPPAAGRPPQGGPDAPKAPSQGGPATGSPIGLGPSTPAGAPGGAATGKPDLSKPDLSKPDPSKPEPAKPAAAAADPKAASPAAGKPGEPARATVPPGPGEPAKPTDASKPNEPPKAATGPVSTMAPGTPPGGPKAEPGKGDPSKGETAKAEPIKAEPNKAEPGKPEAGKADPGKPDPNRLGAASGPSTGGSSPGGPARPGGAVTDGPIIDLKAKRVPEPADKDGKAAAAGLGGAAAAAGAASAKDGPRAEAPKPAGAAPHVAPAAAERRGPGFGSVAAAGLLGGVIGAGLLFGAEQAGLLGDRGADARMTALDQRVSSQFSSFDQRLAGLAPRDALGGLEKRVAANEAALKPLPDAVKRAEDAAGQALAKAGAAPAAGAPATGTPAGEASAPPALPADLAARLDSLDQRVSALQEEPGREQGGDAKLGATTQADADAKQLAALDERLKALEGKAGAPQRNGQPDLGARLAALQGDVEARTKANAEAEKALGERLDKLQQALDARVKAATEAVQAATQATQQAAEAGRTQAQETTAALDRRLKEQADRLAALDAALAQRAQASTVQAALRVVTADRIAAALASGAPYAEPLATLRKLEAGDASRIDALGPFAESGAPSAAQLAAEFRTIADRLAASRRAAEARSVATTGDIKQRFLSMAESIVQVRKVDTPAPPDAAGGGDPTAKVQAALDRGALQEAAQAFAAMPEEIRTEAGDFGARLKARAEAARAAQALLSDAFKGLPAPAEAGR
ncbi:translation initiation factor 2 [Methylobacterium sp. A54F]